MSPTPNAWWRRLLGARRGTEESAAASAIGGRFALRSLLGHGGAGMVFLADDRKTGHTVALKLVPQPSGMTSRENEDWRIAFVREAMITGRLQHPDIVALLDAGVVAEGGWLALEYVPGAELARYTHRDRLLPEALALRLAARIARALDHAHRAGIVHRDLKPSNVRVDLSRGVLKLTDFGISHVLDASQTRTGLTLGTPAYMAPELLGGDKATAAADTWALGVLLFELLSGRRPRQEASLGELLRALARDPTPALATVRPDLPPPISDQVARALQSEPSQRPADLAAWAAELEDLAERLFGRFTPPNALGIRAAGDPMHNRPT